jgi:mono/diheme cytochrome c family protein
MFARRLPVMAAAAMALASVFGAAACDENLSSIAGPTPGLEPTFSSISREIFSNTDAAGRTACVACHTNAAGSPAGGLNLLPDAAYAALVNVPSVTNRGSVRVIPGNPGDSILVRKLEGRPGTQGARMPLNGPPYLTPGQIEIIRRWIELGALDN